MRSRITQSFHKTPFSEGGLKCKFAILRDRLIKSTYLLSSTVSVQKLKEMWNHSDKEVAKEIGRFQQIWKQKTRNLFSRVEKSS